MNLWLWRTESPGAAGAPIDFSQNGEAEHGARLSPNDKYLAYTSTVGGGVEVYVRPFPEGTGRMRISSAGGSAPVWGPDGKELFFLENNTLMRVSVSTTGNFSFGTPERLFDQASAGPGQVPRYGFAGDGQRFLTVETKREFTEPRVRVVQNWLEEFRHTLRSSTPGK